MRVVTKWLILKDLIYVAYKNTECSKRRRRGDIKRFNVINKQSLAAGQLGWAPALPALVPFPM